MTAIRLPVSFVLALCATTTLFWFLGMLTAAEPGGDFFPAIPKIDFTSKIPDTESPPNPRVKPTIPKPTLPPNPHPVIVEPKVAIPDGDRSDLVPRDFFGEGPFGGPTRDGLEIPRGGGSDRGPIPQVRIEPEYPESAKGRGVEGWITFSFTVAKDGSVKDVAILDSDPPRVWDSATRRAVSSWKYQPAIKDGKPVEQRGVTVTYRYELER